MGSGVSNVFANEKLCRVWNSAKVGLALLLFGDVLVDSDVQAKRISFSLSLGLVRWRRTVGVMKRRKAKFQAKGDVNWSIGLKTLVWWSVMYPGWYRGVQGRVEVECRQYAEVGQCMICEVYRSRCEWV